MVTARDVPEIRARMAAWARDPGIDGAGNWFRFWLGPQPETATESPVFDRADDASTIIADRLAVQLPAAELFYVSDDMTELARHAATTLTDYRLHPEDLPAPVGILFYGHPPVADTATDSHNPITAVSWGPGRGGLWVHTWATTTARWADQAGRLGQALAERLPHEEALARATRGSQRPEPDPDHDSPTTYEGVDFYLAGLLPNLRRAPIPPSFSPPHGYDWRGVTPMAFTDMQGWPGYTPSNGEGMNADAKATLERTIIATWLLMGQTLVRSEHLTAPRAVRRRIERDDPHLDPTVRYIDLRRARTEPADHTDDPRTTGREYRHRWIVRGHWRNQWYPSRNDHRPIWIDPHLAGPADMPLLGGERVNVLRR
ncbi:hypothetical protein [Alloactinosynnema sp. L-07]|nr:hypothetical protein [Alloactinosynnema sp. L-07]